MAEATVGVKQSTAPDRQVRNQSFVVGGQQVYEQTVSFAPRTPHVATVTSSGDTVVAAPAVGNLFRLRWYHVHADPNNAGNVVVTLRLGAVPVFSDEFEASQQLAHSTLVEGAVDEALVVNLDAASRVYINLEVEEVAP